MSASEARRFVRRLVSDQELLLRVAGTEDDDELERLLRAEGFECTWQEVLAGDWLPLRGDQPGEKPWPKAS